MNFISEKIVLDVHLFVDFCGFQSGFEERERERKIGFMINWGCC